MQKSDVFSALLYEFKTPHVPSLDLGCRLTGLGQRQFKTKLKKNEFEPSFQRLFDQDRVCLDELAEGILQRRSEQSYE